jgi:hypothetical protein
MSNKKKRHVLRTILIVIGGIFLAFILIAIFAPEPKQNQQPVAKQEQKNQVTYEPIDPARTDLDPTKLYAELASVTESHFANAKRYTYHVVIFQRLNKETLEKIALDMYERAKKETPFNALSVGFYDHPQFVDMAYRFGNVEFVPNGKWGDATTIKTGDYTKMKMNNHLREPNWQYAITEHEAEIISAFFDMADKLSANANTGEELDSAEKSAINEMAQRYDMTYDDVDELITKYNMAYLQG